MKRLFSLGLILICGLAQAYSGEALREDCKQADEFLIDSKTSEPSQAIKSARCIGYVMGVADGYAVGEFLGNKIGVNLNAFCLPRDPELPLRLVRAVQIHLEHMPPNSSTTTATLVAGAFSKAFPCGK